MQLGWAISSTKFNYGIPLQYKLTVNLGGTITNKILD